MKSRGIIASDIWCGNTFFYKTCHFPTSEKYSGELYGICSSIDEWFTSKQKMHELIGRSLLAGSPVGLIEKVCFRNFFGAWKSRRGSFTRQKNSENKPFRIKPTAESAKKAVAHLLKNAIDEPAKAIPPPLPSLKSWIRISFSWDRVLHSSVHFPCRRWVGTSNLSNGRGWTSKFFVKQI